MVGGQSYKLAELPKYIARAAKMYIHACNTNKLDAQDDSTFNYGRGAQW